MNLSQCPSGKSAKVIQLLLQDSYRKRFMDLGLLPGTEITVKHRIPFGGPLVVQFRGFQMSFRREEAKHIQVELIDR